MKKIWICSFTFFFCTLYTYVFKKPWVYRILDWFMFFENLAWQSLFVYNTKSQTAEQHFADLVSKLSIALNQVIWLPENIQQCYISSSTRSFTIFYICWSFRWIAFSYGTSILLRSVGCYMLKLFLQLTLSCYFHFCAVCHAKKIIIRGIFSSVRIILKIKYAY